VTLPRSLVASHVPASVLSLLKAAAAFVLVLSAACATDWASPSQNTVAATTPIVQIEIDRVFLITSSSLRSPAGTISLLLTVTTNEAAKIDTLGRIFCRPSGRKLAGSY
jgi:hypothetical protein